MHRFLMSLALLLVSAATTQAQGPAPVNPDYIYRVPDAVGPQGSVRTVPMILDNSAGLQLQGWSLGICNDETELTLIEIRQGEDSLISNNGSPPAFIQINVVPGGATIGAVVDFAGGGISQGANVIAEMDYSLIGAEGTLATVEACGGLGVPAVDPVIQTVTMIPFTPVVDPGIIEIGGVEPTELVLQSAIGTPGGTVNLSVLLNSPEAETEGFAYALAHEQGAVTPTGVSAGSAITSFNGGAGPDYFESNMSPSVGVGVTVGCVFDFDTVERLPIGAAQALAIHSYQVSAAAGDGQLINITFAANVGQPPVQTLVSVGGLPVQPVTTDGVITVEGDPGAIPMRRGDVNADSAVDLSDAVFLARWLFGVGPAGTCEDAADVDDSGTLQGLIDATFLLNYLFLSGTAPAAPFPACGVDVNNTDPLECASYNAC